MKVALAYHQARGQGGRTMFVSRERAYHGVNFGGLAQSGRVNNRRRFALTLPGIVRMRRTQVAANRFTPGEGAHGVELAEDLQRFVDLYGAENIAACVVEPIAGSTGSLVPRGSRRSTSTATKRCSSVVGRWRRIFSTRSSRCATCRSSPTSAATA